MKKIFKTLIGLTFTALFWSGHVGAFELSTARTSASWVVPAEPVQPYINLSFNAELNRLLTTDGELIISWQDVGGVQPTPFRIIIPAGCFVSVGASMQVRSHRACGVQVVLTAPTSGRLINLPLSTFTAVMTQFRDYGRLTVTAAFDANVDVGELSGLVLGTLGGAEQTVSIGEESSSLLPNELTVYGFNPQPEPPPLEF